jgi:hypothetical protein
VKLKSVKSKPQCSLTPNHKTQIKQKLYLLILANKW